MNLTSLRYFIESAKYLNFTKAAEHLYVTQPTLSRQIMDLEAELGVQLFVRGRQTLTLTSEGDALLEQAIDIVTKFDNIKKTIQPHTNELTGKLTIGYQSFFDTTLMYDVLKSVTKKYPRVTLSLFRGTPLQLRRQLINNQCDAIFGLNTYIDSIPNIKTIELQKNKLQIAVPSTHPLANMKSVDIKRLANDNFIMLNRKISPFIVDYAISLCMKNGFSPHALYYVNDAEQALLHVGSGQGVTFLHSMNKVNNPVESYGVNLLDINGLDNDLNFVLGYKETNTNPITEIFVRELMKVHQQKDGSN
ncbi:LysR substrate-binding domain-containing protein [Lentilactobacillus buchneri]|uniref:LysR substrate-binding domain-containing protein n=1 Tax=Lentilactobacillus buchneri TaxID=1581 RepID=UPI002874D8BA|nr:LysR family transcriptional regulator [Lentilactobacillus buchneri]MDS1014630.1 LysR family transcriptional regulator [Lentilactobacillus buchneri]